MAETTTQADPTTPAAPTGTAPAPAVVSTTTPTPVNAGPSLLSTPPPTGEPPKPPTPEEAAATEKAATESKARADAFAGAQGKDAKLAAYTALTEDEKKAAYKAMPDELKKELGVADPSRPTYADFKLPEGAKVDEAQMKVFTDLAADANLPQEQAQKFIDLALARERAIVEGGTKAFVDIQTKWVSEIKADPEIGGDKLTASLAHAARAIDRLGGDPLKNALDLTGAGNNPAVAKAFVRMGQLLAEDRFRPGKNPPPGPSRTPAQIIYGDAPKQSADA